MASTQSTASFVGLGTELGGRYKLLNKIGRGSSATVFEALDTRLERRVAVKVLHRELASDQAFLDRFADEARAAASLKHSNVMSVHDWGEDEIDGETVPFLVLELLEGGSLRAMLDEGVVCSPSQVIAFGIDACRALNYAHNQGLVHRDITPANLMFTELGTLKIADFGLARALSDSGWTEPGKTLVGTARYASPEQAQGLNLGPESDVYSLGLILIESLSGSVPFSADTLLGTLAARVETDVEIPEAAAGELEPVIREMTRRDVEARPSAQGAGAGLLAAARGMLRPEPLPLVGLPQIPAETEVDADGEVREVDGELVIDLTVQDVADRTTIAEVPTVESGDEPPRRWPVLLLGLVLLAAIGWVGWQQISGNNISTVPVPDVSGLPLDEALAELGDTWVLDEKLERDDTTEQGAVTRTDPEAGTVLEEGAELSYWVSLGLPLVQIPQDDLIGRSEEQVSATLTALGLEVGTVERVSSEDVPEGNVVAITTDSLELPQGSSVDLVASLGPQDRVIPTVDETTDVDQLIVDLQSAGLIVERTEEFDNDVANGGLVSLTPPPGTTVERDSVVQVVVSLGPVPVAVPATSGLSLTNALDLLDGAGFLAELVGPNGQDGGQFASCAVVGTDPPSPTELQPGAVVQILMSDCT